MLTNEISRLMELNKRKAELEFKKGYLIAKNRPQESVVSMEQELAEIAKQAFELESKITAKGTSIFYPNTRRIAELAEGLSGLKPEEIYSAMEKKQGESYSLMESRGKLVMKNLENRWEIAQLVEFVNYLPSKIRDEVIEKTESGEIGELDVSVLDESQKLRLFKLLNRAGVACAMLGYKLIPANGNGNSVKWNEAWVEMGGRRIWIAPEMMDEVKVFEKQLAETARAIQVMNAERQVKKFGPAEESAFMELQKAYLGMLKRREQLLSD